MRTLILAALAAVPIALGGVSAAVAVAEEPKSAEQGDSKSQFSMGQRYEAGKGGVERDLDKAVGWYRKAAEQGHAKAQTNLGNFYRAGKGGGEKEG